MIVEQYIHITPDIIILNGKPLNVAAKGEEMLKEIYRERIGNYPKFFKMDTLCKLGFIASELLLQQEGNRSFDEKGIVKPACGREDRAVFFFNRSGSICDDKDYQQTIASETDSFPSPSLFVYTLPNIVTGEIAIRNRYSGETGFYILPTRDDDLTRQVTADVFSDCSMQSALTGWLECEDRNCFEAEVSLIAARHISSVNQEHIDAKQMK
ncbi:MAG: hypothetical protein MSD82_06690 [Prevotella sp.]|nr:hypothetical protein [Prevotella sp.]